MHASLPMKIYKVILFSKVFPHWCGRFYMFGGIFIDAGDFIWWAGEIVSKRETPSQCGRVSWKPCWYFTEDLNGMNMFQLINGNDLSQIVDFLTREKATFDLMHTSGNLRDCYEKPIPLSPLGLSDHSCVIWKPKNHRVTKYEHKAQITRPLLKSGMQTFGFWIQSRPWLASSFGSHRYSNKADAGKKNGFTLMIEVG